MKRSLQAHSLLSVAATVIVVCSTCLPATAQFLVVTNDNNEIGNSTTIFQASGPASAPSLNKLISFKTSGTGAFPLSLGSVLQTIVPQGPTSFCLFVSNGGTLDVAAIIGDLATGTGGPVGVFHGSGADGSIPGTMALAASPDGNYLYVAFNGANNIATFKIATGCGLTFVQDNSVSGPNGGRPIAMAASPGFGSTGSILAVAYSDGSIESLSISGGITVRNGDLQFSNLFKLYGSIPQSVDITQDGHYAIFGDAPGARGHTDVEVYDISSGHLGTNTSYHGGTGLFGSPDGSSNIRLSPNEQLLYVSNNHSGQVTALGFNKNNGSLFFGCTSASLKGFESYWYFTAGIATALPTGSGSVLWVAEDAVVTGTNGIGTVLVGSANGTCTLTEAANSPESDTLGGALTSLSAFPLRPF